MEQVKIDRRAGSTLITMDEVKKRLKEHYLQLKREHGWSEDETVLNVKSGNNQNKNVKKGSNGKYFEGRCNHCGKFGHKKADCWDLKNMKEKHQENEKKVQKDKSKVRCFKCGKLGHYASESKNDREPSGDGNNEIFAMMCYEDTEDDKTGNGDGENNQESKNPGDYERKMGPRTPMNTENPLGTPPTQLYVFTTQVTNEWVNRILSKVQKSFWSCTHVNSCQNYKLYINLHILLNILCKAISNIHESRKFIKRL